MPIIDTYAMTLENGIHLLNDGATASFDAVVGQHGDNVVGKDLVRIEDMLVIVHGEEVDAFGCDGEERGGGCGAIEEAGADIRDRLDDGGASDNFDVVQHDDFRDGGIELGVG